MLSASKSGGLAAKKKGWAGKGNTIFGGPGKNAVRGREKQVSGRRKNKGGGEGNRCLVLTILRERRHSPEKELLFFHPHHFCPALRMG